MRNYKHFWVVCLGLFLISCQPENKEQVKQVDPFQKIKQPQVLALLQKALQSAGGIENWDHIHNLKFDKHFTLFDEQGKVDTSSFQHHEYQFLPSKQILIKWDENLEKHQLLYNGEKVTKKVNQEVMSDIDERALLNSIFASTFVMEIPFNLLDQGVELSYLGIDTLAGGEAVEVLEAKYNSGSNASNSNSDIWWHFFSKKDYRHVGYMVKTSDHYSLVENVSIQRVNGINMPIIRKSYRVDSLRNIQYLRADYKYQNYEVLMQ